jgi:hypothetical protein
LDSQTKVSVAEFKKIINTGTETIAKDLGWNYGRNVYRGYSFQIWVSKLFCNIYPGIDTEPDESMAYSKDLTADLVLEDSGQKILRIVQCKFAGLSKPRNIDETEVNDFFHRHEHFMKRKWVRKHGSDLTFDLLGDYAGKFREGYSINYYFVSTAHSTDRVMELANTCAQSYESQDLNIACEVIDFSALKELYVQSLSLQEVIPEKVILHLPEGRFFVKKEPHPTVIASIKGNALINLFREHKESLFTYNIRGYLGARGAINKEMRQTIEDRPTEFFYFNNGISAICTEYELEENVLSAYDFQIINGAQTVGSLVRSDQNPDIEVLFRLTKAEDVKTEKGINRDIILYNNSQNIIKASDFRANDDIHIWLYSKFNQLKVRGSLETKLYYIRRRGGRQQVGKSIRLEELAKIRYAFLHDPVLVNRNPSYLWTYSHDGGVYEKSFGVDGTVPEVWSDEEFERCILAIVLYLQIEKESKELAQRKETFNFLRRFRYHALSLAKIYIKNSQLNEHNLLTQKKAFDTMWRDFWKQAVEVLIDFQAEAPEHRSIYSLLTTNREWESIKGKFERKLSVASQFS